MPHFDLIQLGIAEQISQYSYLATQYAYLEEDADLSIFMQTALAQNWRIERKTLWIGHHYPPGDGYVPENLSVQQVIKDTAQGQETHVYTFLEHPQRGWLKVPRKEIKALGLTLTDSRTDKTFVYSNAAEGLGLQTGGECRRSRQGTLKPSRFFACSLIG